MLKYGLGGILGLGRSQWSEEEEDVDGLGRGQVCKEDFERGRDDVSNNKYSS